MNTAPIYEGTSGQIPAAQVENAERILFIGKVYAVFFTGVLAYFGTIAALFAGLAMESPAAIGLVQAMAGIPFLLHFALVLGAVIGVQMIAHMPVINVFAFYAFAVFMGVFSIFIVLAAFSVGGIEILIQAGALTTLVMGSLTAFVFITRADFSSWGTFLFIGIVTLIGASLMLYAGSVLGFIGAVEPFSIGLSLVAVILFMGYVLYDTSKILHRYSVADVIPAAVALLIDFIMLFKNILFLLMMRR